MRKIPMTASLLTFLDEIEYEHAALSADDETKELAKPFEEELEAWEAVFKKEREGRRSVIRAEALVAVRNAQLDTATIRFGASVLGEAGGDRKGAFFRRFFSVAPSQFVRQPLRKQCEHTLNVMAAELDKLDKKHALRAFAEPLAKLAKGALASLDARAKAKADRSRGANDVEEWKEGVNALRLSTYAELLKIAAEKGYTRAWADSFFPSEATSGGEEAPAPPAQPEATPSGTKPEPS
jgi:hypothetical protein